MSFSDSREALTQLGFAPLFQQQLAALPDFDLETDPRLPERVAAVRRGECLLLGISGTRRALLSGRLQNELAPDGGLAVGDWVLADALTGEPARIVHLFSRTTIFRRKAWGVSAAQNIAANVDVAFVVTALSGDDADPYADGRTLNVNRIERYLVLTEQAGARGIVVVNKCDLTTTASERVAALRDELRCGAVLLASAHAGDGISELRAQIGPTETAVVLGSSGVGKSSLANRLMGSEVQRVTAVRVSDGRGRHTTTERELLALPGGGFLIDTPGMRELALFAEGDDELSRTHLAEIDALAEGCRFGNCSHKNEPGCAVLAAVQAGTLTAERLEHARTLRRELARQQKLSGELLRQQEKRRNRAHTQRRRARKPNGEIG